MSLFLRGLLAGWALGTLPIVVGHWLHRIAEHYPPGPVRWEDDDAQCAECRGLECEGRRR